MSIFSMPLRKLLWLNIFPAMLAGQALAEGQRGKLPYPAMPMSAAKTAGPQIAVFAGGCFWGVEAVFRHVNGVISATSGYAGGSASTANYKAVSRGKTAHAEAVQVVYNPQKISYGQLLKIFFAVAHNPTELNRQGPDRGPQYRSTIFTTSDSQLRVAAAYINQLQAAKIYPDSIVTQVQPLPAFYPAEAYHQDYVARHPMQPYIVINDLPKLRHLREQFPELYRQNGANLSGAKNG